MSEQHMIAQCIWHTHFDLQMKSVELQDFISKWSNSILLDELEAVFGRNCPLTQTWRIDSIELDLQDIHLDDLPLELPRRLRRQLQEAFDQLLVQNCSPSSSIDGSNLKIFDHQETMRELISYFLLNGNMPWWYKENQSILFIFDEQLKVESLSMADIIKQLGVDESVRLRLVHQFGEKRLRTIIGLLEPSHAKWICSYADHLFEIHQQERVPHTTSSAYRELTWNFILTHLIVDRGTLFNTVTFVRANLFKIAQHYQLNFSQLIQQMLLATKMLEAQGRVGHRFINAMQIISQTERQKHTILIQQEIAAPDYWTHLQEMLHAGISRSIIENEFVHVDDLFCALAIQDSQRLAKLLRLEGTSQRVRNAILEQFSESALIRLVQILEPHEQAFIISQIEHTKILKNVDGIDQLSVWQIVLAYLLVDGGSHFQRRQLVHYTVQSLSQAHRIEYHVLLSFLIHALQYANFNPHRYALLMICHDLQTQQKRQEGCTQYVEIISSALIVQGKKGNAILTHVDPTDKRFHNEQLIQARECLLDLLHAKRIAEEIHLYSDNNVSAYISTNHERSLLLQVLAVISRAEINDIELSKRLLELVGLNYFSQLVQTLEPEAASFCVRLIEQIMRWKSKGALPSLNKLDFVFVVPRMVLQALPSFYGRHQIYTPAFDLPNFLRCFLNAWGEASGNLVAVVVDELRQCLSCEQADAVKNPSLDSIWVQQFDLLLSLPSNSKSRPDGKEIYAANENVGFAKDTQLTVLSRYLLSPNKADIYSDAEFDTMWNKLCQRDNTYLMSWIERDTEKHKLLDALIEKVTLPTLRRWWTAQLPPSLNPPEKLLALWYDLILNSGQWQGASVILERHIRQIFWRLVFDARNQHLSREQLEARMLVLFCQRTSVSISTLLDYCHSQIDVENRTRLALVIKSLQKEPIQHSNVHHALALAPFDNVMSSVPIWLLQDAAARYLDHPVLLACVSEILQNGRAPKHIKFFQPFDLVTFYCDLFHEKPDLLHQVLSQVQSDSRAIDRLLQIVPFTWLLDAISRTVPHSYTNLLLLKSMSLCIEQLAIPGVGIAQLRRELFSIVLHVWLKQDWSALMPQALVHNFAWVLLRDYQINKNVMQLSFAAHLYRMPESLRLAFQVFFQTSQTSQTSQANKIIQSSSDLNVDIHVFPSGQEKLSEKSKNLQDVASALMIKKAFAAQSKLQLTKQIQRLKKVELHMIPIRINNAGLVMLQTYIPRFFEGLGLLREGEFVSNEAQQCAVHALQFLVTGSCQTDEQFLSLNKLLCGLPLHHPVPYGWQMSEKQIDFSHSLLDSMMQYWRENSSSTKDGFRGNWLVRNGSLTEASDHWALIVDRRPYDVLMGSSPFSYSIIKLQWMKKAIYVTWPV